MAGDTSPTAATTGAGAIRRLRLDELDSRLAAELAPRVARLGYLGELFAVLGHQPDALLALMDLARAVRAPFETRTVELVLLTVSSTTGNRYEQYQHEQLARRQGLPVDWIRDAVAGRPDTASALTDDERIVQRLVLAAVTGGGHAAEPALEAATATIGDRFVVGVLLLTGYAALGGLLANTLALTPPVPPVLDAEEEN